MSYEEETTDLRARVRELEAELADLRTYRDLHYCGEKGIVERATAELKARAEKAEAALVEEKKRAATGDCAKCGGDYANVEDHISLAHMLREKAESRAAELEARYCPDPNVRLHGAREREAE